MRNRHLVVVNLLLQKGALVDLINEEGCTPLQVADHEGIQKVLRATACRPMISDGSCSNTSQVKKSGKDQGFENIACDEVAKGFDVEMRAKERLLGSPSPLTPRTLRKHGKEGEEEGDDGHMRPEELVEKLRRDLAMERGRAER